MPVVDFKYLFADIEFESPVVTGEGAVSAITKVDVEIVNWRKRLGLSG